MSLFAQTHNSLVFKRRTRVLSEKLAALMPDNARLLDIGCGDGTINKLISQFRPDLTISGTDLIVRPETHIPVEQFDGITLPYGDNSVDTTLFVDVLHHTDDPEILLKEAARVSRRYVIIKDHRRDGFLAGPTLRFMDWVGKKPHGIPLPYNYWSEEQWRAAFSNSAWKLKSGLPTSVFIRRPRPGSSTGRSTSSPRSK